ncbi:DEAD/DEAH box helicase family protein [Clostridium thermobutyricum]|uniref:DEAD/DEAH box helicase family protein n=1 Tax=Clostridium thermobutyricum TaxID=29372 RepID=UPI001FABCB6F|nr:DEAD/DEAH box helicase family protein [Clostridium thermobutyricum]
MFNQIFNIKLDELKIVAEQQGRSLEELVGELKEILGIQGDVIYQPKQEKTLNELWCERKYEIADGINLIVAPCGSGKTYFTFNTLIKGVPLEDVLYLCDTRNLKNAVALDKEYHHLCRFYDSFENNNIVSGSNCFGDRTSNAERITVMTYAQFGLLAKKYPKAFRTVKLIVCDEAHQAIDYHIKFDNEESNIYKVAVNTINKISKQAKVVLLTATPDRIKFKRIPNIFDFSNEPNIKRLKERRIIDFNTSKDIQGVMNQFKLLTEQKKVKMLIYTDRITTVKNIVNTCHEVGLRAVGLWSLNNTGNVMSTYQLECLKSVVEDSLIPDDLDVLVINASLQTGVNIKNNDIDWVLVNSTCKTTQVQSRGRVRKDIDRLYIKTKQGVRYKEIKLEKRWLNTPLTSKDKKKFVMNYVYLMKEEG